MRLEYWGLIGCFLISLLSILFMNGLGETLSKKGKILFYIWLTFWTLPWAIFIFFGIFVI